MTVFSEQKGRRVPDGQWFELRPPRRTEKEKTVATEQRPATDEEIAAFEAGEQKAWQCPECGRTIEVLSALMVFCDDCRAERRVMVAMKRVGDA